MSARVRGVIIGHVAVVARFEHDDFVARLCAGEDGVENGLRGPGRDGDFAIRIVMPPVERVHFFAQRLAQRGQARHGRVLVVPGAHGVADGFLQRRVAIKIGKALAQIDGLVPGGQCRHGGENRRADVRQAVGKNGRAGRGHRKFL